jgi:hypothetical protein
MNAAGARQRPRPSVRFSTHSPDQSLPPAGLDPGQPNPKEAISPAQLGPARRPLVHGKLLAQREVFEGELALAAAEEREKSKQMEHEGDHQARILCGSELIDQPTLPTGWSFGEGQGANCPIRRGETYFTAVS